MNDAETSIRSAARDAARKSRRWAVAIACWAAAACIQVVQTAPPQEPEPRAPEPFVAMEEPKLVPTDVPGLFAAPSLDSSVYYYKPDELWYRYAYRRWFQAFRWDGAWFVPDAKKLPEVVKARVPQDAPKTVKEQVKALDKKLEDLDKAERLKQLEDKMKELDAKDAAGAKSTPAAPSAPAAGSGAASPPGGSTPAAKPSAPK